MTDYLEKHNLKTKEEILQRIKELKRNTFPNQELINYLSSLTANSDEQHTT